MALEDFDDYDSLKPVLPPAKVEPPAPEPAPANPEVEDLFDFQEIETQLVAEVQPTPVEAPPEAPVASAPAPEPLPEPAPEPELAAAAQLVEDIEEVLVERREQPSMLALAGIAALVLTNVLGLLFLWRTTQSVQSGVQAMNEQFVETLRRQALSSPAPAAGSAHAAAEAPAPLEAFEKSALHMAREEIQAGEYAAARRRLSRLLAVADRIEAEERADIEAQAAFLIASTYRKQAEAAREKAP